MKPQLPVADLPSFLPTCGKFGPSVNQEETSRSETAAEGTLTGRGGKRSLGGSQSFRGGVAKAPAQN